MAKEMGWMKMLEWLSLVLVGVGAINWGLVGLFGFDIALWLANILGWALLAKIIYVLIGAAGVYFFVYVFKELLEM
jgi:uncharacterized membrane protein YuzA (DUF378 family)